jgi:hypothetical protein
LFSCPQDAWSKDVPEGVTRMEDLSTPDAAAVRRNAFLELTVLGDEADVRLLQKRRKFPKKRNPKKKGMINYTAHSIQF